MSIKPIAAAVLSAALLGANLPGLAQSPPPPAAEPQKGPAEPQKAPTQQQAPTEQQKAEADKKAAAAAKAEKDKAALAAAMDRVANRWRSRAAEQGWETKPAAPVEAKAGFNTTADQSSASGQPGGRLGQAAAQAEIRSEKKGTAPASPDTKQPQPGNK